MKFLSALLLLPSALGAENVVQAMGKSSSTSSSEETLTLTVTNLSRNQPFSGFFVMTHNEYAPPVYTFGKAASAELRELAENGNPASLVTLYDGSDGVCSATTSTGPTGPGGTLTIEVMVSKYCPLVSVAAMAVNTNDALVTVNGQMVQAGDTIMSDGLDAGTEENNELCSSIPGPGCDMNSGNSRDGNGEGFVHVHAGFHGVGDLTQTGYDWRNPMMQVEVSGGYYYH